MRIGDDKLAHAGASAAATFVGVGLAHAIGISSWWAIGVVLAIGGIRELGQYATARWIWALELASRTAFTRWYLVGDADWWDMAANGAGVAGARLLLFFLGVS